MAVARATLKYSAAGVVTALYAAAIYKTATKREGSAPIPAHKVVIVASAMTLLTWAATVL